MIHYPGTPDTDFQERDGLKEIEALLRRTLDVNGLRVPRMFPLAQPLDLSGIAGPNVIITHIGFYPENTTERPYFSEHFYPDHEDPHRYQKGFRVALFTHEPHPTYGAEDRSFQLKGFVRQTKAWQGLVDGMLAQGAFA